MSAGWSRWLALKIGRLIQHIFPEQLSSWARAMRYEIAEVEGDLDALYFALGCLRAASIQAITFYVFLPFSVARGAVDRLATFLANVTMLAYLKRTLKNPRWVGIACAIGAITLGAAYMTLAGAPKHYLGINATALVLSLVCFALITRSGWDAVRIPSGLMVVLGGVLLATAMFGISVEGASRWVRVGPLSLQISLIVVPVMLVFYAQRRDSITTAGIALTGLALAIQPDRAMAGVLAGSLAVLAIAARDRWTIPTLVVAVAAFTATLIRPDTLPAVPYVDQVLYSAFAVHSAAGIAVLSGAFLLVVPAIAGRIFDPSHHESYSVFGLVWLGSVVAAAVGNYPTPLVGYGGSAVLGYVLSLSFLPRAAHLAAPAEHSPVLEKHTQQNGGTHLFSGVAYSN